MRSRNRVFFGLINAFSIDQTQRRNVHISFRRRIVFFSLSGSLSRSSNARGNTLYTHVGYVVSSRSIKTGGNRGENGFHRRSIARPVNILSELSERAIHAGVYDRILPSVRGICIWIFTLPLAASLMPPRFRLQADPLAQRISFSRAPPWTKCCSD